MEAMKNKDFAILILTYGRPDRIVTITTLRGLGYSGKIYLVCSSDDESLNDYKKKYGDDVIVFDKDNIVVDLADNIKKRNTVTFARNAAFCIAKELGLKYFLELDDDYTEFQYKLRTSEILIGKQVKSLNWLFDLFLNFLHNTPQVTSIAFAQGGDFIGGKDNKSFDSIGRKRKLMNCYFNAVNRPYIFYGRCNDDVNCYVQNGKTGTVFLTHYNISIVQAQTQAFKGGSTELHLEYGTYVKSFYTVLFNPSAVKVRAMGEKHRRLHHHVKWKYAVPQIIRETHKK